MGAAAADYVALSLDGTDVLLMAADHALRRELSRRICWCPGARTGHITAGHGLAVGTTTAGRI